MKILSIPLLLHDSSIAINDNGNISYYRMEERFSRKKHDLSLTKILDNLIQQKLTKFDKIIVEKYYLDDYVYKMKLLMKKLKKFSCGELIIQNTGHHLLHAFSGFYNSNFNDALCISLDGGGSVLDFENDQKILETESIFYLSEKTYKRKLI